MQLTKKTRISTGVGVGQPATSFLLTLLPMSASGTTSQLVDVDVYVAS